MAVTKYIYKNFENTKQTQNLEASAEKKNFG